MPDVHACNDTFVVVMEDGGPGSFARFCSSPKLSDAVQRYSVWGGDGGGGGGGGGGGVGVCL